MHCGENRYLPFHACPGTNTTAFDHPVADIQLCAKLNATMVKVDALGFSADAATTEKAMMVFEQAIQNSSKPDMLFSNCVRHASSCARAAPQQPFGSLLDHC